MDVIVEEKTDSVVVDSDKGSTITNTSTDTVAVSSTNVEFITGEVNITGTSVAEEFYNVVVEIDESTTIVAGQPGPIGPPGISEDSVAYARQTDFIGDSIIYKGEAEAGTSTSSPYWRIRKITILNDDISEVWADGNTNFDNIWDNRLSLNYS